MACMHKLLVFVAARLCSSTSIKTWRTPTDRIIMGLAKKHIVREKEREENRKRRKKMGFFTEFLLQSPQRIL